MARQRARGGLMRDRLGAMKLYRLGQEQTVARPLQETFRFFADPRNPEALTPAFLPFSFVYPPPSTLEAGVVLDYRIRLHGVPIRWRSRIDIWEPPTRFVDSRVKEPYSFWHHSHFFEDAGAGRTLVRDVVEFALPIGPLDALAYRLFVARSLTQIFDFRAERLKSLL